RKRRKYNEEFDDRVFVISPRTYQNGRYHYDDKTTIALHGVPINGWVDNANDRLASFEGGNRNLSTGCVNLEAYAFDLINELSQNHCPMYILPEDENNYFHIKNRELAFSTRVPERKQGSEPARRCEGGEVKIIDGTPACQGGDWVEDFRNVNRYYFSDLSREIYHDAYEIVGAEDSRVVEELWQERERLVGSVTAGNIDGEDFEDLAALTYAASSEEATSEDALAKFKDLYNAYYELKEYRGVNFDLLGVNEKRQAILDFYLDPNGFEKSRREKKRSVYAQIDRKKNATDLLSSAQKVRFLHHD
ncbi:MAG: hypothetical protein WD025_06125, partial [Bacteriovoracaceae bacterium]